MSGRFKDLKEEFGKFVGSFSTWAKAREEADQAKIKQLYKDIAELDEKINAMDAAMAVIGAALGATLSVVGILATLFPPAAPWIVVRSSLPPAFYFALTNLQGIGMSIAGVELGSLAGLAIAKCSTSADPLRATVF